MSVSYSDVEQPLIAREASISGSINGDEHDEGAADLYEVQQRSAGAGSASGQSKYCTRKRAGLVTLVITLMLGIVAIVGVFVIAPKVAKNELNNTQLTFVQLNLTDPQPVSSGSNTGQLTTTATAQISKISPMSGSIAEMTATVSFNGYDFGEIDLPSLSITAGETLEFTSESQFTITDLDVWNTVAKAMITADTIDWRLSGKVDVTGSFLGISMKVKDVTFDKTISLPGASGLSDVTLEVFDLSQSTADKVVVDMTVLVNNPSIVNIVPAGNLEFDIEYKGYLMGTLGAASANLYPGYSELRMTGELIDCEDPDIQNELLSNYLSDIPTVVAAVGTDQASDIDLYRPSLIGLELDTTLEGTNSPLLTKLDVSSMTVTPIDDASAGMLMVCVITYDNPLGPNSPITINSVAMTIDVMDGEGTVLGTITTDPLTLDQQTETELYLTVNQDLVFPDGDSSAFSSFMVEFLNADSVDLKLSGTGVTEAVSSALGDLTLTVPVDLSVTLAGMAGLSDVTLEEFSIPADDPSESGEDITVDVVLNNPTVGSLAVDLEAQMLTPSGVYMGALTAPGLVLEPGANNVQLTGIVNPTSGDLSAVGDFFSTYLQGTDQNVRMVGTGAGTGAPQWLTDTVQAMDITTVFPGYSNPLGLLTEMNVVAMDMDLTADPPLTSGNVTAVCHMPSSLGFATDPDSEFDIPTLLDVVFNMVDETSGDIYATVEVASVDVEYDHDTGDLSFAFPAVELSIVDEDLFGSLLTGVLNTASVSVRFAGTSGLVAVTSMGSLTLSGLAFDQTISVAGINGFSEPAPEVGSLDITGDDGQGSLVCSAQLTMTNPSVFSGNFGATALNVLSQGVVVGVASVESFEVSLGEFALTASVIYTEPADNPDIGVAFLSTYIAREDQEVTVVGTSTSTTISYLLPALEAFSTSSSMPGMSTWMLTGGIMSINLLHPTSLPTVLVTQNPNSADITITAADTNIFYCANYNRTADECLEWGDKIGMYTPDDLSGDPIVIPAGSVDFQTNSHIASGQLSASELKVFLQLLQEGDMLSRTENTLNIQVGTFSSLVSPFLQNHVMIQLS